MDQYIQKEKEQLDNNINFLAEQLILETKKDCTTYKELKNKLKVARNRLVVTDHWSAVGQGGYVLVIDKAIELVDEEIGAFAINKDTDK